MTRPPITRVGLQLAGFSFPGVMDNKLFESIVDIAQTAENSGYDSLWIMDHFHQIESVGEPDEPILEAYTTLAALAAVTSSASLGVLVSACGFRNPALLAKMVSTIDIISGGRAMLGIGAGWHEAEFLAYGLEFPPPRERIAQLAEAVQICRAMFTEHAPRFSGKYHRIDAPFNEPRPLNPDGPPILIGGSGERHLIPTVAQYGDACNFFGAPATVRHRINVLERACEAVGRDSGEITKTWLGTAIIANSESELEDQLERLAARLRLTPRAARGMALCGTGDEVRCQVAEYRAAGVDGMIVTVLNPIDLDHLGLVGATLRQAMDSERTDSAESGQASTPEQFVGAVWAQALGLESIDPHVGFFDLGASSTTVVKVVQSLRQRWPNVKAVDIFSHPTVAQLADRLGDA